tara:strand:+ start:106 stop:258 length:153 start_codon:yes stop_codon:yes gene_type:complete
MSKRNFTVVSNNLAGFEAGKQVSEKELASANIEALIAGGHIKETGNNKKE